ncbi:hypothetical protein EMPS_04336 [Entomortierella parvispora]|uniref:NodB homology domain-containing protein n=1 Tax=Entomortierella parvispora TaxID=205924 RepID=A0A9P3LVG6_9FUNG|nr:hypothetical protein EMPS_04336 [Entomortierella parvispora]
MATTVTLHSISLQATAAPIARSPRSTGSNKQLNDNNLAHFPYPVSTSSTSQPLYQPGQILDSCVQPNSYAISFDDGPGQLTDELLDFLDEQGLKVTFFMNGDNWSCIYGQESQRLLKRAFQGQHQIAAHPWSHSDLEGLDDDAIRLEMRKIEDAFRSILGVVPRYMRPPFGEHSERVRAIMEEMGYVMILWDVDRLDSESRTSYSSPSSQEMEDSRWEEEDDSDELVMSAESNNSPAPQLTMAHHQHRHGEDEFVFSSSSSNKWAEAVRGLPYLTLDRDDMVMTGIYQEATSIWAVEYVQSLGLDIMPVAQCLGETDPRHWYKEITKPADPASLPRSCYL